MIDEGATDANTENTTHRMKHRMTNEKQHLFLLVLFVINDHHCFTNVGKNMNIHLYDMSIWFMWCLHSWDCKGNYGTNKDHSGQNHFTIISNGFKNNW